MKILIKPSRKKKKGKRTLMSIILTFTLLFLNSEIDVPAIKSIPFDLGLTKVHAMTGAGTSTNPYMISTSADLVSINSAPAAYYKLANNVAISGSWTSLSNPFTGNLDGQGFTISNISANAFFNSISGGTVKNLNLVLNGTEGNTSSSPYCAVLTDTVNGATISNVNVTQTSGSSLMPTWFSCYIGALVGLDNGTTASTYTNCSTNVTIDTSHMVAATNTSIMYAGGFIGGSSGASTFTNCSSAGTIDTPVYNNLGGFSGASSIDIGGFAGTIHQGSITGCNSSVNITDESQPTPSVLQWGSIGGMIGSDSYASITTSYATGNISTSANCTGGFIGSTGTTESISKCYSTGSVNNIGDYCQNSPVELFAAGFIASGGGTIANCYSTSNVNYWGNADYGGTQQFELGAGFLAAGTTGTLNNCYYAGTIAKSTISNFIGWGSITGLSTDYFDSTLSVARGTPFANPEATVPMQTQSTYSGWDFTNTWNLSPGKYPLLIGVGVGPAPISPPTIATSTPITNQSYSCVTGHNQINVSGSISDSVTGDIDTLYYTLNNGSNLSGHTNVAISPNITSNGSSNPYNFSIPIDATIPQGIYTLEVWVQGGTAGASTVNNVPIIVDTTPPTTLAPTISNITTNSMTVTSNATDGVSGLAPNPYLYNRNSVDVGTWTNKALNDSGLTPNEQYTYTYKAEDAAGNVSNYSPSFQAYTLALDPTQVQVTNYIVTTTGSAITFNITNNPGNAVTPNTCITLKVKGTSTVRTTSGFTNATTKTLTGLVSGEAYDIYLQTENGDGVTNPAIQLTSSSTPSIIGMDGNPINDIPAISPVTNFTVSSTDASSISTTWDDVANQQYQVYLLDANGNRIGTSAWISTNTYDFSNLNLVSNAQYVPYIVTRNSSDTSFVTSPLAVNNQNLAYTNAQNTSTATFTSAENSITITLDLSNLNNSSDTQYIIQNDITGQTATVNTSNPTWANTGLAEESYYTYSVKPINKNGQPSSFTQLVFSNSTDGKGAHTTTDTINVSGGTIGAPDPNDPNDINLDALANWNNSTPIGFNPTQLQGKTVIYGGKYFIVTQNKEADIKNTTATAITNGQSYEISRDGYGYSDWKPINADGTFDEPVYFNEPGFYNVTIKFENSVTQSSPLIKGYLADWAAPTIDAESQIPGQTAVSTGATFNITASGTDNISPYIFYSTDNGTTWYLFNQSGSNNITFSNINTSANGVLNNLTLEVSDICGNVTKKQFPIWGIQN